MQHRATALLVAWVSVGEIVEFVINGYVCRLASVRGQPQLRQVLALLVAVGAEMGQALVVLPVGLPSVVGFLPDPALGNVIHELLLYLFGEGHVGHQHLVRVRHAAGPFVAGVAEIVVDVPGLFVRYPLEMFFPQGFIHSLSLLYFDNPHAVLILR